MIDIILHRIDSTGRALAPVAVTVMLILGGMSLLAVPGLNSMVPMFGLMGVFYWAIHRPDLFPLSAAFIIGLLYDLLSGGPPGMNTLLLVLAYWVLMTQRRFFLANRFIMLWWGFSLIAIGAGFVQWLAFCLLRLTVINPTPRYFSDRSDHRRFPGLRVAIHAGTAHFSTASIRPMDRDADRHRLLTRRALTLGGLQLGLLGTLVGRLYYLQIVQSSRYAMLADENRISLQLLAPPRGEIMDRYGVPLAINQQNFRLQANTEQIRDLNETLAQLARIVPVSETDLKRIEREHRHQHRFVPLTIRENLSWDQVSAIELNAPDLPGVSIDVGQTRHYPYGEATAHVLGYVGLVAETELTGEPLLALPGFRIGKSGVEKTHDVDLRGTAGTSQMEVNNVGRIIRELSRQEGTPGSDVTLTLDIGLQTFAQDRLKDEQSAAAVVIDVHTGGIYALASYPSYDVNQFTLGINNELWHSLITNPTAPLTDKVVAGQYAPGSTFKTMVAMAALETGTIGPDHTVFCPGSMQLGDHTFHCWKHGGHGTVDMIEAVAQSCDVYFYDLAKRIGIDKIAETAREFGLGSKLDIDLQGERPGNIPDQAWKKRVLNASWQQGETLVNAIGQGYVLATPLQLGGDVRAACQWRLCRQTASHQAGGC